MVEKIGPQAVRNLYETQQAAMMGKEAKNDGQVSFGKVLGDAVENLNQSQVQADTAIQSYLKGDDVDLHTVMIALEKAQIDLRMAMQIRNKVIQAYEEIKRMQF